MNTPICEFVHARTSVRHPSRIRAYIEICVLSEKKYICIRGGGARIRFHASRVAFRSIHCRVTNSLCDRPENLKGLRVTQIGGGRDTRVTLEKTMAAFSRESSFTQSLYDSLI